MDIDMIEIRDRITPKHIVFGSFIIIAIIVAFSFYTETRSQKLPALVKTENLHISSSDWPLNCLLLLKLKN